MVVLRLLGVSDNEFEDVSHAAGGITVSLFTTHVPIWKGVLVNSPEDAKSMDAESMDGKKQTQCNVLSATVAASQAVHSPIL